MLKYSTNSANISANNHVMLHKVHRLQCPVTEKQKRKLESSRTLLQFTIGEFMQPGNQGSHECIFTINMMLLERSAILEGQRFTVSTFRTLYFL